MDLKQVFKLYNYLGSGLLTTLLNDDPLIVSAYNNNNGHLNSLYYLGRERVKGSRTMVGITENFFSHLA
jgi:hypothetical protein